MKYLKFTFLAFLLIITSCKSELKEDKFIGKWNVYSLIDSNKKIGGGKMFRNSIKSNTPVQDLDFEIQKSAKYENSYILSGFYGNQVPVFKVNEHTLINQMGEDELKVVYNEETQHLILKMNNVTIEYEKVNSIVAENKKIVELSEKIPEKLTLQDLQSLLTTPHEISKLKRKGYSFLYSTDDNGKIYIGIEKDTVSVYKGQVLWKGKNIKIFQSIEKDTDNLPETKLDKEQNNYSYTLYNNEYENRESKQLIKKGLSYVFNKNHLNDGILYDFFIMSSEATSDGE